MAAGDGSIAIGNVLGSNVANLGLALGLAWSALWRSNGMHWWVMLVASMVFLASVWDLVLSPREGMVLFAGASCIGQLLQAQRRLAKRPTPSKT